MSWSKALKIIGSWFGLSVAAILFLLYTSPLAGATLALLFFAVILVVCGSPIHIFVAYKKPHWSNIGTFLFSLLLVFMVFIVVAGSGVFNFT